MSYEPHELTIVLEGVRPLSWNQIYVGVHWSKRKRLVDEAHWLTRLALPEDYEIFTSPVDITITSYFSTSPLDCDNIAAKLYIDGLCGYVLADDSPRYVSSVTTKSRVDKKKPRVEIKLRATKSYE